MHKTYFGAGGSRAVGTYPIEHRMLPTNTPYKHRLQRLEFIEPFITTLNDTN